jgi:hypothetical protein
VAKPDTEACGTGHGKLSDVDQAAGVLRWAAVVRAGKISRDPSRFSVPPD